jgi:hypothetical protein
MTDTFALSSPVERRAIRHVRRVIAGLSLSSFRGGEFPLSQEEIDLLLGCGDDPSSRAIIRNFFEPGGPLAGLASDLAHVDRLIDLAVYGQSPPPPETFGDWLQGDPNMIPPGDTVEATSLWLLQRLPPEAEGPFLDVLDELSPGLGRRVRDFRLNPDIDIVCRLADCDVQRIVVKLDSWVLALVLTDSTDATRTRIFENMSRRAADHLRREISEAAAAPDDKRRSAMTSTLLLIRTMLEAGEIVDPGK